MGTKKRDDYELRFWAQCRDGRRTVSYLAKLTKGELYITPRGQGMFKVSLHKSGVQQISHLEPFWQQVKDDGSRHLDRWSRTKSVPRTQTRLFKIVLPAEEMVELAPIGKENPQDFTIIECEPDDVVEVQFVYIEGYKPNQILSTAPNLVVLATWPFENGTLSIIAERDKLTDAERDLIRSSGTPTDDVGNTEGPRPEHFRNPEVRRFLQLENEETGLRGLMEARDHRDLPSEPRSFRRRADNLPPSE